MFPEKKYFSVYKCTVWNVSLYKKYFDLTWNHWTLRDSVWQSSHTCESCQSDLSGSRSVQQVIPIPSITRAQQQHRLTQGGGKCVLS